MQTQISEGSQIHRIIEDACHCHEVNGIETREIDGERDGTSYSKYLLINSNSDSAPPALRVCVTFQNFTLISPESNAILYVN